MNIKNKTKKYLICSLIVTIIFCNLTGCNNEQETYTQSGVFFDTAISITLYENNTNAINHCFEMAKKYESYFSTTLEDSDIYQLNHHPNTWIKVHPETIYLLTEGMKFAKETNGVFQIGIGALSNLWNVTSENPKIPSKDEITTALHTLYVTPVEINQSYARITSEGTQIDLGGFAKGYIADQMKEYLLSQGIHQGIINLGGNVIVIGKKSDTSSPYYHIAIQKPFSSINEVMGYVKITDMSVVTSGIYQRYFEKDNKIYHHIFDTSTGYPVENSLSSVTILCSSSMKADFLSTYVFSLGLKKGLEYIENEPNTEAIFITRNNKIHYSSGINQKIPFEVLQ